MRNTTSEQPQSHLFTVRVWLDGAGQPDVAWRGKVQHPVSGAWRYFRDWEALIAFLQNQMTELAAATQQLYDLGIKKRKVRIHPAFFYF